MRLIWLNVSKTGVLESFGGIIEWREIWRERDREASKKDVCCAAKLTSRYAFTRHNERYNSEKAAMQKLVKQRRGNSKHNNSESVMW